MKVTEAEVGAFLERVRTLMAGALSDTVLARLLPESEAIVGSGKMLRSRLAFRVGLVAGVPEKTLVHACAAVELIHAASLLHDDVIDGGALRRGAAAFWLERGVAGAILVGDLMLFKALDLTCQVEDGRLTHQLVRLTGEVCDAESEQELCLRGKPPRWDDCVRIARRKTGALFAFAGYAAAGDDAKLREALQGAGYLVGTAYQLSDDILDATGDESETGKSLGRDGARAITTAATAADTADTDPAVYIEGVCREAAARLTPWPAIDSAWREYMDLDMWPALRKHLAALAAHGRP